jgi:hypothetical protein
VIVTGPCPQLAGMTRRLPLPTLAVIAAWTATVSSVCTSAVPPLTAVLAARASVMVVPEGTPATVVISTSL